MPSFECGVADLVAFGRHFTSNPDLPHYLKPKQPLTPYICNAFWGGVRSRRPRFYSMTPNSS